MVFPKCPKCGKSDKVKVTRGCRCMSCPPWVCDRCRPYKDAPYTGYEFYADDVLE